MFSWNVGWAANIGGDNNDYAKVRANSTRGFNLFRLGASYQHTTESDWLFGVNAYSQWTKDNLISSEQFGAGGMGSVRGREKRRGVIIAVHHPTPSRGLPMRIHAPFPGASPRR